MNPHTRSVLTCGLLACVSLAWCADAYLIRIRNNSLDPVELEVVPVDATESCGSSDGAGITPLPGGETYDLVCGSTDGSAGFCLRPAPTSDWIRLDCSDHPLEDVVDVELFGR